MNEGKGKGYEPWATIFNLKQMAKTLNYLQENNLLSYDVLEKKAEGINGEYDELLAQIKATENRLTEIKELKTHIINYMKTKGAYAEYKQSGYSKKVQAKYETELTLHKASKAYFNKLGLEKLPTIKSLQTEEQELHQAKNQAYGKYKKAKTEMQDILNAKMNIDRILNFKQMEKTKEKKQEAR